MQKKVLGIDLGGTSVKLAILSKEGDVLQKWSIPTDNSDGGNYRIHQTSFGLIPTHF